MSDAPRTTKDLARDALAVACEAVRDAALRTVEERRELKAVPIGAPLVEWSRGHLRSIRDQRLGVYEKLGEMTVVFDGLGRLLELEDPRHEPREPGLMIEVAAVIDRVAELCGLSRESPSLRGEVLFDGTHRYVKISTIPPAAEVAPGGRVFVPPHAKVEAHVNAATGGIWRLRHEPPPRRRLPKLSELNRP